jgi:hypothetical protein
LQPRAKHELGTQGVNRRKVNVAYQLWTSSITGYRRKGTRLSELRALLGSSITAHAILEPLQSCPADASATEMARILANKDFDFAGVQSERDGPVVGYVVTAALTGGVVREHLQPMTAEHLVSETIPLASLLSVLKERKHVFVLVGSEVRGIVTRADLNKPPVRVYLFGLVSLLEMHLGFWVRATYQGDSWHSKLNRKRLHDAREVQAYRERRGYEIELLECLQFCDRRDLVLAKDELRERLGLREKAYAKRLLKCAEDLRNNLAHSQQDLAKGSSWEKVVELVEWVEMLVHKSDECVEEDAKRLAHRGEDKLWPSP